MEEIFIDHHLPFFYNPPQSPFYKGGQRGIKGEKKDFPWLTRNSISQPERRENRKLYGTVPKIFICNRNFKRIHVTQLCFDT
jgi:hypothetical protein